MEKIAVIGSGTMGNGIAQIIAQSGYSVALFDISSSALHNALETINSNLERLVKKEVISEKEKISCLENINTFTSIEQAVTGSIIVIEAATENKEIKINLFKELDRYCAPECILASNTSSISIAEIAAITKRPEQVIGMHFMNPVPLMKLVEVIRGFKTSDKTTQIIMDLSLKLGKTAVTVNDYPGFVANRILMPMINEAAYALFEGVAGVSEIDTVMKLGMSHPMGPLQLADFIGLDICLAIMQVMHNGFGKSKYAACPLIVNMVKSGNLGVKTGIGFYDYTSEKKEMKVSAQFS